MGNRDETQKAREMWLINAPQDADHAVQGLWNSQFTKMLCLLQSKLSRRERAREREREGEREVEGVCNGAQCGIPHKTLMLKAPDEGPRSSRRCYACCNLSCQERERASERRRERERANEREKEKEKERERERETRRNLKLPHVP